MTPSCNGFSMAKYYCNICKFFDDERYLFFRWNLKFTVLKMLLPSFSRGGVFIRIKAIVKYLEHPPICWRQLFCKLIQLLVSEKIGQLLTIR